MCRSSRWCASKFEVVCVNGRPGVRRRSTWQAGNSPWHGGPLTPSGRGGGGPGSAVSTRKARNGSPKSVTMPGSQAVPGGGSRHARFTQEPSFGHWWPFRSFLPEGAIRTPALSGVRSVRGSTSTAWVVTRLSRLGFCTRSKAPRPVRDRQLGRLPVRSGVCFDGSTRRCLTLRANTVSRRQAYGLRRRKRITPGVRPERSCFLRPTLVECQGGSRE